MSAADLAGRLLSGDTRALARAITLVEDRAAEAPSILREAFPATGGAFVLGITGFPGSGKSSLVDRLTAAYRGRGKRVGVVGNAVAGKPQHWRAHPATAQATGLRCEQQVLTGAAAVERRVGVASACA